MKKYFEVIAKCGHVGRNQYYEGRFYVIAESASDAAKRIRSAPRVKHNHSDAILSVQGISVEEYLVGIERNRNNPYFKIKSSREQQQFWDIIKEHIYPETATQLDYRDRHSCHSYRSEKPTARYGLRNYYKYNKLNPTYSRNSDY